MANVAKTLRLNLQLKGSQNYIAWSIRTKAILTEKNLSHTILRDLIPENTEGDVNLVDVSDPDRIKDPIQEESKQALALILMLVDDYSILHIQYCQTAKSVWDTLENVYNPKGFTTSFLVCKEFLDLDLGKFKSMEDFVNKVKYLLDELRSRKLDLPLEFTLNWILNSLSRSFDPIVIVIIQSLRNNSKLYSIEQVLKILLDESKRLSLLDTTSNSRSTKVLYTKSNSTRNTSSNKTNSNSNNNSSRSNRSIPNRSIPNRLNRS